MRTQLIELMAANSAKDLGSVKTSQTTHVLTVGKPTELIAVSTVENTSALDSANCETVAGFAAEDSTIVGTTAAGNCHMSV
jgi:hypothetical protein